MMESGEFQHHLNNPDRHRLAGVYWSMNQLEEILISVESEKTGKMLNDLEETGFTGILVNSFPGQDDVKITALKGKEGPCLDTGKKVVYKGAALAVLDDDNHLLLSGEPLSVCEKTASVFSNRIYKPFVDVIIPDKEKTSGPVQYFNCGALERDQEKIYSLLKGRNKEDVRENYYYPGPFRILILHDGTLVRRGKITKIPVNFSKRLIQADNLHGPVVTTGEESRFFQDLYDETGTGWMLEAIKMQKAPTKQVKINMSSLSFVSSGMRTKLLNLIEKEKPCFILTGSDPADPEGCCPSDEVSEANHLVQSGILSSLSQEAGKDACPVTVYAFNGEIIPREGEAEFSVDNRFRESVRQVLEQNSAFAFKNILKWLLLAFIVFSVTAGIVKLWKGNNGGDTRNLHELLAPEHNDQMLVLLFHNHIRCLQCSNMEQFTRELLAESYPEEMRTRQIAFRTVDMEVVRNTGIMERFNFIAPTVVLLDFEDGKEREARIIEEGWQYFREEQNFKTLLDREIGMILKGDHE